MNAPVRIDPDRHEVLAQQKRDADAKAPKRCVDCGYILDGHWQETRSDTGVPHDDGVHRDWINCPECGRAFHPDRPATYTHKPPIALLHLWMPAFLLTLVVGTLWCLLFYSAGELGWGLTLGVPSMVGVLMGYQRQGFRALGFLLGAGVLCLAVFALFGMGFAGLFCGIFLLVVFGGIAAASWGFGVLMGLVLSQAMKRAVWFTQRAHLRLVGLVLVLMWPGVLYGLERVTMGPPPIEAITTHRTLAAPPAVAWDAWMFYEDVNHAPPMLLRLGLPKPIKTVHRIEAVGDEQICVYDKGRLVKRATLVEPGVALAFDVIEQVNVENVSLTLIDGRFDFHPAQGGRATNLALTTRYTPKLTPRWVWRPIEQAAGHALHGHVLDGMHERLAPGSINRATVAILTPAERIDR